MKPNYTIRQTNAEKPLFIEVINLPVVNMYMTYGFNNSIYLGGSHTVAIFKIKYK